MGLPERGLPHYYFPGGGGCFTLSAEKRPTPPDDVANKPFLSEGGRGWQRPLTHPSGRASGGINKLLRYILGYSGRGLPGLSPAVLILIRADPLLPWGVAGVRGRHHRLPPPRRDDFRPPLPRPQVRRGPHRHRGTVSPPFLQSLGWPACMTSSAKGKVPLVEGSGVTSPISTNRLVSFDGVSCGFGLGNPFSFR